MKKYLLMALMAVALGVAVIMPSPAADEEQPTVMVTRVLEPGETIRTIAKDEYPNQSRYKNLGQWVAVVIKANGGRENFGAGDRVILPMSLKK